MPQVAASLELSAAMRRLRHLAAGYKSMSFAAAVAVVLVGKMPATVLAVLFVV